MCVSGGRGYQLLSHPSFQSFPSSLELRLGWQILWDVHSNSHTSLSKTPSWLRYPKATPIPGTKTWESYTNDS